MNTYFEVGVRYDKTMEDGVIRKVTENYLLDAISFTEAEKRATEEMEAYISGEFRVVTEKITNIAEVVTTDDASADKFYKVKHSLITIDFNNNEDEDCENNERYCFTIYQSTRTVDLSTFQTFEEAVEAALKYCLTKLI